MAIRILHSVLPPATDEKKGGIIVGNDLGVTEDGTLTIGGVISEIAGKGGSWLYTDGTKLEWKALPGTIAVDRLNTALVTTTYLKGSQGDAILNSLASNGAYVAFSKYNSTNGKFTIAGHQTKLQLHYMDNATVEAGTNSPTKTVTFLDESGNSSFPGTITAPLLSGTATAARYADLAEKYIADKKYPIGTLVCFGGEKEITEATKTVNGVVSEKPGFILNSESKGLPVALAGKVKIRTIGKVNKFDKLVLSNTPGVARARKWYDVFKKTIAIALETNTTEAQKLVCGVTKFIL